MTELDGFTPANAATKRYRSARKRKGPTARKGDVQQELKAAAARLFQARGYTAVSIDDIVAEVGVTKGGFYHYFDSKDTLLFALHDEYVSYSIDCFKKVLADEDDPELRLRAYVHESFRQIHEFQEYVGTLFDERRFLPSDKVVQVERKKDELRRMLIGVLQDGIERGVFRAVDTTATSLAVFGMCTWGYQWYRPDARLSHEQLAEIFADLAVRAVELRA